MCIKDYGICFHFRIIGNMHRFLFIISLLFTISEARALETIKIECQGCNFEQIVGEGTSKMQFASDGLWGKVFYCKNNSKFVICVSYQARTCMINQQ